MVRPASRSSRGRKWLAVAAATVLQLVSYAMIVFPFLAGPGDEGYFLGAALGVGMGLVPLVFAVGALLSQNQRAAVSVVRAFGLWLVLGLPIAYGGLRLASAPVFMAGLVVAYGAGGIVAFRREDAETWQRRAVAVVLVGLYTLLIVQVAPVAGLFGGAVLPFAAIAFADEFGRGRSEDAAA